MLEAQKDILLDLLSKAEITLLPGEKRQRVLLNGFEITDQIRTPEIVKYVSQVSAIPEVRSKLVSLQQQMGEVGGVIMDGRDIGTTVFPNADLKIFLIASSRERASRRQIQQRELGIEEDLDSIQAEIERRDFIDTTRAVSPLSQAADAILIDTDQITIYEVVDKIIATLNTKLGESKKGF
jgi:cytidylate kinase